MIEVAVHQFDLWRFLHGTEVEHVHVWTRREDEAARSAVVAARMAKGVLVSGGFSEQSFDNCEIEIFVIRDDCNCRCIASMVWSFRRPLVLPVI